MFEIKGKYATAKVMAEKLEVTATSQIYEFLSNIAFKDGHIAIMPDCHAGKGAVIGFTMPLGPMLSPNIVGVDQS